MEAAFAKNDPDFSEARRSLSWAIITGEYPWQPGGISDYTRLVAKGLAEAGDEVHVWAPASAGATADDAGVEVRRLPGQFGPQALTMLDRELAAARCDRILIQYAPHAFGWKAMNVGFCGWLLARRRETIWTTFHEVAYPCAWRQSMRHNLLGAINRIMASMVAKASQRIFISCEAWEPWLKRLSLGQHRAPIWLPVPSNLPLKVGDEAVATAKARVAGRTKKIVGHFGTFSALTADVLETVLLSLLKADVNLLAMLLGRGAYGFARRMVREHPNLRGRLIVRDDCTCEQLAVGLATCDVLVQPYSDGVSSRRGSLMAGLALGRATVTNEGASTERFWHESKSVMLTTGTSKAMAAAAQALLADSATRASLGARAAEMYRNRFALEHTIRQLLA